jgi:hypothetical protein
MKLENPWFLFLVSLLLGVLEGCDPCSGEIYAHSPADLEALAECEVITGDLTLGGGGALAHLDALSSLTAVEGYLYLYNSSELADLDGLANLTSVGGYLRISGNTAITSLAGFSSLSSVGGDLQIFDNPSLCQSSVDALVAACTIGGGTQIAGNDSGC